MFLRKSIITDITLPNSNVKNEPHNKKNLENTEIRKKMQKAIKEC